MPGGEGLAILSRSEVLVRPARLAAVLLLLCTMSVAKSPKKSDLNRIITQARYVMVIT